MIFCNECGNSLDDGLSFCTECGAEVLKAHRVEPLQATMRVNVNPNIIAAARAPVMPYPGVAEQRVAEAAFDSLQGGAAQPPPAPAQPSPHKGLLLIFGMVAMLAVAVSVYFATRSPSNSDASHASVNSNNSANTSTGNTSYSTNMTNNSTSNPMADADSLASSLNTAIDNGRLVTLTGDDAYTYFTQLRNTNPQHPLLGNVKSKVLPKLRSTGEEMINRKVNHSGEVSEQDWRTSIRAYEWAHMLEPGDKALEARQKYVQGKLAEAEDKKGEAWQDFNAAAQLDSSWAVPPNDLGVLTTQQGSGSQKWSNAISYYKRAINLQPGWEIPYNNLGTAYFYLDDYDTAEGFYRQAIQRNSNWARPHKWLGDIYVKKNMYGVAIGEYQAAVNLYNPNTDSLDIASIQKKIAQLRASGY